MRCVGALGLHAQNEGQGREGCTQRQGIGGVYLPPPQKKKKGLCCIYPTVLCFKQKKIQMCVTSTGKHTKKKHSGYMTRTDLAQSKPLIANTQQ